MASLSLKNIRKEYTGGTAAVHDFNLEVADGEFIVIVGPSGSGKSTVLKLIAGLEQPTGGDIYIDGKNMSGVEPKYRDIAMIFQDYALFPHMTVYENMAFGLKIRKIDKATIDKKVREAADILGITELLPRRPKEISGGECQRVALGRALVREPKIFLLDEPLTGMDAKLRIQMRTEIEKVHHRLKTTFVYVTHDQTEAMTMGNRIVVMNGGTAVQTDTPERLYDAPTDLFVATFLGSPQMNVFKAPIEAQSDELYAIIGETPIKISASRAATLRDKGYVGKTVYIGIRPEDVHYEQALVSAYPDSVIEATVDVVENLGHEKLLYVNTVGKEEYVTARVNSRFKFNQGQCIGLYLATEKAHFFDIDTELNITA